MKLIFVLVLLVLISCSDGKRKRKKKNVALEELRAKVTKLEESLETLTAEVSHLKEEGRGVHIHFSDGHHHHDHHGHQDNEHHEDHHDHDHSQHHDDHHDHDHSHHHDDHHDHDHSQHHDDHQGHHNHHDHSSHSHEEHHHNNNGHSHDTEMTGTGNQRDGQNQDSHEDTDDQTGTSNDHHHDHHDEDHHSDVHHYPHAHHLYVEMYLQQKDQSPRQQFKEIQAHCKALPNKNILGDLTHRIMGNIYMSQINSKDLRVEYNLHGGPASHTHGVHVHTSGDMSAGCDSLGPHYNPTRHSHGSPGDSKRHVGDFGNIESNEEGLIQHTEIYHARLSNLIGRSFVIHENADDMGKGETESSRSSGSSGRRIACCVIGLANPAAHLDHDHDDSPSPHNHEHDNENDHTEGHSG